jgi:hypothetical protein
MRSRLFISELGPCVVVLVCACGHHPAAEQHSALFLARYNSKFQLKLNIQLHSAPHKLLPTTFKVMASSKRCADVAKWTTDQVQAWTFSWAGDLWISCRKRFNIFAAHLHYHNSWRRLASAPCHLSVDTCHFPFAAKGCLSRCVGSGLERSGADSGPLSPRMSALRWWSGSPKAVLILLLTSSARRGSSATILPCSPQKISRRNSASHGLSLSASQRAVE